MSGFMGNKIRHNSKAFTTCEQDRAAVKALLFLVLSKHDQPDKDKRLNTSVRDNKLCLKALSCIYIRDIVAWQPSIYHGWLLRQNPHVKYAMLEKTQLFRIFDNVSSKCLGLVVKETVCP